MSEILVEDGAVYPSSVTVPEDGDARNAASVVVGFQTLANRCAHIMLKMGAWILGGTVAPAGSVLLNLLTGHLTIDSNDDWGLHIGPNAKLFPNGRMGNHLFAGDGGYGRPNKRVRYENLPADGTVDPTLHDRILLQPLAANRIVQISPSVTPVTGDHAVIQNNSATYSLTVKNPSGGTMIVLAPHAVSSWAEVFFDGALWAVGPSFPGA
jgi:hypothetical protein